MKKIFVLAATGLALGLTAINSFVASAAPALTVSVHSSECSAGHTTIAIDITGAVPGQSPVASCQYLRQGYDVASFEFLRKP
jgi:hypothetical protein